MVMIKDHQDFRRLSLGTHCSTKVPSDLGATWGGGATGGGMQLPDEGKFRAWRATVRKRRTRQPYPSRVYPRTKNLHENEKHPCKEGLAAEEIGERARPEGRGRRKLPRVQDVKRAALAPKDE